MNSVQKRLFISFFVSVGGILATWYFFTFHYTGKVYHTNEKALALVENIENISRKKLAEHRTWQVIQYGDSLYSGETIKTNSDSDLQIRFLETDTVINLEPDSLITIKKDNNDDVSFNLVEGNIFVDSSQAKVGASALKVETAEGTINLTGTSASLAKSKNAALDLTVLSGKASKVGANGESQDIINKTRLQITSPKPLSILEVKEPQIKIKWLGDSSIKIEELAFKIGTKRSDLAQVTPTLLKKTEAILPARYGKNLVLVEYGNDVKRTSTVRFELKPIVEKTIVKIAPPAKPIAPVLPDVQWSNAASEELQAFIKEPKLELKWSLKNPKDVKSLYVQIKNGEDVILTEKLDPTKTSFVAPVKKSGRYLASIEARDEKDQSLSQSKLKTILAEEIPHLPAPSWDLGQAQHKAQPNGSYETTWSPVSGAFKYRLTIKNKNGKVIKEWAQRNTAIKINNLQPGEYSVTLTAIDLYERTSPNSVTKNVLVSDTAGIEAPKVKKMRFK